MFVILVSIILILGLMSGTAAGLTAALSPLSIILPAAILARRLHWSWPRAIFVPFMFPVFLYALFNSTFVTLVRAAFAGGKYFIHLNNCMPATFDKAQ